MPYRGVFGDGDGFVGDCAALILDRDDDGGTELQHDARGERLVPVLGGRGVENLPFSRFYEMQRNRIFGTIRALSLDSLFT